jgi:hypothetical protein
MVDSAVPLSCTAEQQNELDVDKEAQQQALRAIFFRIRKSVRELLGK